MSITTVLFVFLVSFGLWNLPLFDFISPYITQLACYELYSVFFLFPFSAFRFPGKVFSWGTLGWECRERKGHSRGLHTYMLI